MTSSSLSLGQSTYDLAWQVATILLDLEEASFIEEMIGDATQTQAQAELSLSCAETPRGCQTPPPVASSDSRLKAVVGRGLNRARVQLIVV